MLRLEGARNGEGPRETGRRAGLIPVFCCVLLNSLKTRRGYETRVRAVYNKSAKSHNSSLSAATQPAMEEASVGRSSAPVTVRKANWRKTGTVRGMRVDHAAPAKLVADPVLKRGMFQMKALLEELPKTQSFERKKKEAEKEKKKDHELREVLLELLKTEGNYLADLQFTTKEFAAPLHALLKQEQYFDIFANLEQLEQLHMRLETDPSPRAPPSASTTASTTPISCSSRRSLRPRSSPSSPS